MKIEVSDLFDDLFAVATVAYPRFRLSAESGSPDTDWNKFCCYISDTLFLPACATRASRVSSERLDPKNLKRRILTQKYHGINKDQGRNAWYSMPRFYWNPDRPNGFAAKFSGTLYYSSGASQEMDLDYEFSARPEYSLTLHLGELPPSSFFVERPAYDANESIPKAYFCQHYFRSIDGPRTTFYETHGDWCLREVELAKELTKETYTPPRWLDTSTFTPIKQEVFDQLWSISEPKKIV